VKKNENVCLEELLQRIVDKVDERNSGISRQWNIYLGD
jgi:hypothetical protein